MLKNEVLREAKRLYDLGWAVHWIKPKSKAPVKSGWSSATRDDWPTLKKEYRDGYGLGVRMGEASKLEDGYYLANIDVDLKGQTKRAKREALAVVDERFPGIIGTAPCVVTEHGMRFFVKTRKPEQSGKISSSNEMIKVRLPTAEVNKRQLAAVKSGELTQKELDAGWRIRAAWEVEFLSIGKQVVLPPSIHPDTEKPYQWQRGSDGAYVIPRVKLKGTMTKAPGREQGARILQGFEAEDVDLSRLSPKWRRKLKTGEGVDDRSAASFALAMVMLRAGYTENEILSVLTDRDYYLGETAYDHRKTNSRRAAAAWVRDYCVAKAKLETSAAKAFAEEVIESPRLKPEKKKAAVAEVTRSKEWRNQLDRSGKDGMGPPKPTLENIVLILQNAVAPDLFKRDTFASREFYGVTPPWQGTKGDAITDSDAVMIKLWLGKHYRFEPSVQAIFEAITWIGDTNAFHPVRAELEALPAWDGVSRLNTWLKDHFNAKGPADYLAEVFRKWLVAAVTRVYRPGAKFDWMPIFEGKQGTGKSSFGAILFGQDWFADWLPDLGDKDAALGLLGRRCVEFGELDRLRRNELETIKAFVTRQIDKVRPPYGRKTVELPRQTVFFGTTNKKHYLVDDTGNRRFNPVGVGHLDFEQLRADRDQLWAEALFIYNCGLEESLYLTKDTEGLAKIIRDEKRVFDEPQLMAFTLFKWLEAQKAKDNKNIIFLKRVAVPELFSSMGPLSQWKQDARNIQFAGKALHSDHLRDLGVTAKQIINRGYRTWNIELSPHPSPSLAPGKPKPTKG